MCVKKSDHSAYISLRLLMTIRLGAVNDCVWVQFAFNLDFFKKNYVNAVSSTRSEQFDFVLQT